MDALSEQNLTKQFSFLSALSGIILRTAVIDVGDKSGWCS